MNKNISLTGIFAALTFVFTAYIFHIPAGTAGYMHIGDTFIYLAASILPLKFAMISGALGGMLADTLLGAVVWVIPTMIVKPILALCFKKDDKKIVTKRNILGSIVAGAVGTFLYMIAGGFIYGFEGAFAIGMITLIQPIGSTIFYVLVGSALDKINFIERFTV